MKLFDSMKHLNLNNWREEHMFRGICGLIKLIMCGVAFGTVLGLIGIYLLETNRRFRFGAKKMCQKVEDFSQDVKARIDKHEHEPKFE